MTEFNKLPQDTTQAIRQWRGNHGADLAWHIKELGLPPHNITGRSKSEFGDLLGYYIDTAEIAAEEHLELLAKIGGKNFLIFSTTSLPRVSVRYRTSLRGNSEGIGTLQFEFYGKPIFHARLMWLRDADYEGMVVLALQRYTDEKMTTVEKPYITSPNDLSIVAEAPSLKDSNPERYSEYLLETKQIKRFEMVTGTPFQHVVLATCLSLAKATGEKRVYLTEYNNQYWVKVHQRRGDGTVVPNIYDSSAQVFGMEDSELLPGFWELGGESGEITFPEASKAIENPTLNAIAQSAYASFLTELR